MTSPTTTQYELPQVTQAITPVRSSSNRRSPNTNIPTSSSPTHNLGEPSESGHSYLDTSPGNYDCCNRQHSSQSNAMTDPGTGADPPVGSSSLNESNDESWTLECLPSVLHRNPSLPFVESAVSSPQQQRGPTQEFSVFLEDDRMLPRHATSSCFPRPYPPQSQTAQNSTPPSNSSIVTPITALLVHHSPRPTIQQDHPTSQVSYITRTQPIPIVPQRGPTLSGSSSTNPSPSTSNRATTAINSLSNDEAYRRQVFNEAIAEIRQSPLVDLDPSEIPRVHNDQITAEVYPMIASSEPASPSLTHRSGQLFYPVGQGFHRATTSWGVTSPPLERHISPLGSTIQQFEHIRNQDWQNEQTHPFNPPNLSMTRQAPTGVLELSHSPPNTPSMEHAPETHVSFAVQERNATWLPQTWVNLGQIDQSIAVAHPSLVEGGTDSPGPRNELDLVHLEASLEPETAWSRHEIVSTTMESVSGRPVNHSIRAQPAALSTLQLSEWPPPPIPSESSPLSYASNGSPIGLDHSHAVPQQHVLAVLLGDESVQTMDHVTMSLGLPSSSTMVAQPTTEGGVNDTQRQTEEICYSEQTRVQEPASTRGVAEEPTLRIGTGSRMALGSLEVLAPSHPNDLDQSASRAPDFAHRGPVVIATPFGLSSSGGTSQQCPQISRTLMTHPSNPPGIQPGLPRESSHSAFQYHATELHSPSREVGDNRSHHSWPGCIEGLIPQHLIGEGHDSLHSDLRFNAPGYRRSPNRSGSGFYLDERVQSVDPTPPWHTSLPILHSNGVAHTSTTGRHASSDRIIATSTNAGDSSMSSPPPSVMDLTSAIPDTTDRSAPFHPPLQLSVPSPRSNSELNLGQLPSSRIVDLPGFRIHNFRDNSWRAYQRDQMGMPLLVALQSYPNAPRVVPRTLSGADHIWTGYTPQNSRNNSLNTSTLFNPNIPRHETPQRSLSDGGRHSLDPVSMEGEHRSTGDQQRFHVDEPLNSRLDRQPAWRGWTMDGLSRGSLLTSQANETTVIGTLNNPMNISPNDHLRRFSDSIGPPSPQHRRLSEDTGNIPFIYPRPQLREEIRRRVLVNTSRPMRSLPFDQEADLVPQGTSPARPEAASRQQTTSDQPRQQSQSRPTAHDLLNELQPNTLFGGQSIPLINSERETMTQRMNRIMNTLDGQLPARTHNEPRVGGQDGPNRAMQPSSIERPVTPPRPGPLSGRSPPSSPLEIERAASSFQRYINQSLDTTRSALARELTPSPEQSNRQAGREARISAPLQSDQNTVRDPGSSVGSDGLRNLQDSLDFRYRASPSQGPVNDQRPTPSLLGDYLPDEHFDGSYEGLLRLSSVIGEARPRGLPGYLIDVLPSGLYKESFGAKKEERCPICIEDYKCEDMVLGVAECEHYFHKTCFERWLQNSRSCPVCRRVIQPRRGYGDDQSGIDGGQESQTGRVSRAGSIGRIFDLPGTYPWGEMD